WLPSIDRSSTGSSERPRSAHSLPAQKGTRTDRHPLVGPAPNGRPSPRVPGARPTPGTFRPFSCHPGSLPRQPRTPPLIFPRPNVLREGHLRRPASRGGKVVRSLLGGK